MKEITYLSLGAGVQSSALYVMSALELHGCPKAAAAIFADTGDEPAWVYRQVADLATWGARRIPILQVSAGHLSQDIIDRQAGTRPRFAAIPAYTAPGPGDSREGQLRRQCTREYKIEPIRKRVRELLGLRRRQHAKGKVKATALLGISLDEIQRAKPSRDAWIENTYPLIDARMRREDCGELLRQHGFSQPKKSACLFCPYHDDAYWRDLKANHPKEWERAVGFDQAFRNMSRSGVERPVFLHRSCQPLDQVDLTPKPTLWDSFSGECEGLCGV